MPKKIGADKQRESRTLGEAVGAEITRLRVDRGWSQSKLAHDLGYTERYIGQLERGARAQLYERSPISPKPFPPRFPPYSEPRSGDIAGLRSADSSRGLAKLVAPGGFQERATKVGADEEFSNLMPNEIPLRTFVTSAGRKQLMLWPCVFSRTLG